jgi:hypothetical protein
MLVVSVNGYADSRTSYTHARTDALLPADDVPTWSNLTELDLQLRWRWRQRAQALLDAGYFFQGGWGYPGGGHDVPAYRPLAVINEAYGSYDLHEHLQLTLGKKRVTWGSGLAVSPMDLLNPPKDPTDPSLQRAGAWLARIEAPFERFTFTLVGAARATRIYGGVPGALLYYPEYPSAEAVQSNGALPDDRDDEPHYALAARLYALVADTDLNLVWTFTNLYQDAFEKKHRLGISAARLIGKSLEVHAEALLQRGTKRPMSTLGEDALVVRAVLGPRYFFADDSSLGAEYLFNGDGYSGEELANLLALASSVPRANRLALQGAGARPDPGSPQKLRFDPLRRHYLFLMYTRPRLWDDFTVQATLFGNLHDLTGIFAPLVTWSATEWLSLTLAGFIPLPGVESRKLDVAGRQKGELDLSPLGWRAMFSARTFY